MIGAAPWLNGGEGVGDRPQGLPYLRLVVHEQCTALLPMTEIQQVLVLPPQQLTAIPNMPAIVMGLLNVRNRIVWVLDLAHLFNLEPLDAEMPLVTIALLDTPKGYLGLALKEVRGIARLPEGAIQSPVGTVSAALVPYLKGCCRLAEEIFFILDGAAIAERACSSVLTVDVG
ncbi:chemotaxis protein CheW [Thermosynechococcus vestitus]|uniref:Tll0570 protein n=1 Tax=Thermosynechococcus vestitus (strain NIES-2133 / IAM M-273 / BP-1) TaxID=197221 RepID=Q8DLC6_THEVB|nr:chemotaxis protein CheW [Thermosynechococcus vestitus]BAC08122.1 tll0570 [Thermosynechococcus vestitus BP-1]